MHKLLELVLDFVVHFEILHKMYPCKVAFSKFKDTDNSCIFCNVICTYSHKSKMIVNQLLKFSR